MEFMVFDEVRRFIPDDGEVQDMVEAGSAGFFAAFRLENKTSGCRALSFESLGGSADFTFIIQREGRLPKDQRRVGFQFSGGPADESGIASRIDLVTRYDRLSWEKRLKVFGVFVDFSSDMLRRVSDPK